MRFLDCILVVCVLPNVANAIGTCTAPGPAFPPVDHLLDNTRLAKLKPQLDSVIQSVLASPKGWTTNITSFALSVTSANETIWDFFHTAPILGDYEDSDPTPVSGDTAFRVASISKSFTVYAVLLENGINLDDSITKYVPELLEGKWPDGPIDAPEEVAVGLPDWKHITIRSLASQLSGIAREGGLSDLAFDKELLPDPVSRGFPPIVDEYLHPCMKGPGDRACNASEIYTTARKRSKVYNVNARSTYSNVAFSLLGMVLEKATGKSYLEAITASILKPLGMNHTRTTKPKDSEGIIPYGPNDWAQELGSDAPSGGIYSTTNDFNNYLRSILSSELLPEATTNAWMKPHSWTEGLNSAYGMPWEILRTTKLTPDGRAIDIITKGGALTGYFSNIILIPEFGLGITTLIAGSRRAMYDLRENLIAALVPAVEKLIRDEVREIYGGVYAEGLFSPPWDMDWSLRLEVDEMGPGLRVLDWLSNGTEFLPVYGEIKGMPSDPSKWQARLIPSGIDYLNNRKSGRLSGSIWRLTAISQEEPIGGTGIFDDECYTDSDSVMYDGFSLEEFKFIGDGDENGRLEKGPALMLGGLRSLLFRVRDWSANLINVSNDSLTMGSDKQQAPLMSD